MKLYNFTILTIGMFLLLIGISFPSISQNRKEKNPELHFTNWINTRNIPQLEGHFLVLDFWATWCAPCLASVPHMNKLEQRFQKKTNLRFISISNEKPQRIKKILQEFDFNSYVVTDTTRTTQSAFKITALPTTILLDNQGQVQWRGQPEELTTQILTNFLNGKRLRHNGKTSKEESTTRKLNYDSLYTSYLSNFDQTAINNYFDMAPVSNYSYGSDFTKRSDTSYKQVKIGVSLKEILSSLLNCTPHQIHLPSSLQDKFISYCFAYSGEIGQQQHKRALLERILNQLNLDTSQVQVMDKKVILQVEDSSRFIKTIEHTPMRASHASISEDEHIIGFKNSSLKMIIRYLSKALDKPVLFKNSSTFHQKFNITLKTAPLATLRRSLKQIGIEMKTEEHPLTLYKVTKMQ